MLPMLNTWAQSVRALLSHSRPTSSNSYFGLVWGAAEDKNQPQPVLISVLREDSEATDSDWDLSSVEPRLKAT